MSDSDGDDTYTVPKLSNGVGEVLSRPKEWLLLVENRLVIAIALLAVLFVVFVGIELAVGVSQENLDPLYYVLGGIVSGNLTLITVVVSINQLVISQQLGSPGDLREEIRGVTEFREDIEDVLVEDVVPVTPTEFVEELLDSLLQNLDSVRDEVERMDDDDAADEMRELIDSLAEHIEHTETLLSRSEAGVFESLSVMLNTNYSREIYRARQIQSKHAGALPEELDGMLDTLVVRIQQIDVSRQYLKTLYLQDEFAYFSRVLLYAGIPAEVVTFGIMLAFAASAQPAIPPQAFAVLVPVVFTVVLAPLAILFAFVLRVATVAQRTAAITPFTTPTQERTREFE